jgi:hypothetical protein
LQAPISPALPEARAARPMARQQEPLPEERERQPVVAPQQVVQAWVARVELSERELAPPERARLS